MKIYFTEKEFKDCSDFAEKVKQKHQHFKDKNNKATRTLEEVAHDVIRGKLAEVALRKYLLDKHKNNCNISDIDYTIYPEFVGDSYDLKFNQYIISIKSSKEYSSCLLIEKERFLCDENGQVIGVDNKKNNLPDYYVFVRVKVDYEDYKNSYAEICGGISHKKFMRIKREAPRNMVLNGANAKSFFIEKKPPVYTGAGVRLLATNYGVHMKQLTAF